MKTIERIAATATSTPSLLVLSALATIALLVLLA